VQEETFVGLLLVVACHSWQMYVVFSEIQMLNEIQIVF
jgi:hypothetical protein